MARELSIRITADTSSARSRLAETEQGIKSLGATATRDGGKVVASFEQQSKSMTTLMNLGPKMQSFGSALTVGVTAPILGIGGAAITMAMNAVESENLFSVAFGDMAGAARAWSEETSAALGLNEFELRRNAGVIYTMTEAMGLNKDAAFEMSTGMVELAADMASFFNISSEEAFTKLRAGIVGETEPLRQLGVVLSEASVQAYAYGEGITAFGKKLTEAEKVQARWGLILEQTATAQGDLARTIESPTNQLRIMKEEIAETSVKLGMALLPLFQQAIGIVSDLVPYLSAAVGWFAGLPKPMQTAIIALAGLAAAVGPVMFALGGLIPILSAMPAVMGSAAVASTGLAAGLATLALRFTAVGAVAAAGAAAGWWLGELIWGGQAVAGTSELMAQAHAKYGAETFKAKTVTEQMTEAQDRLKREMEGSRVTVEQYNAQLKAKQESEEKAKAATEALARETERQRDMVRSLGLVTRNDVVAAMDDFSLSLKRATDEGIPMDIAMEALTVQLKALIVQAKGSGIAVDDLEDSLAEASRTITALRGGVPTLNAAITRTVPAARDLASGIRTITAEQMRAENQTYLTQRAFAFFGTRTRTELRQVYETARQAYADMASSGQATAAQLTEAFGRVRDAGIEAGELVASGWQQALPTVANEFEKLVIALQGGMDGLKAYASDFAMNFVAAILDTMVPGLGQLVIAAWPILEEGLKKLGSMISDFFSWAWDGLTSLFGAFGVIDSSTYNEAGHPRWGQRPPSVDGGIAPDIVPAMAMGGVVMPRAGGTIVRVAEAGRPEAIVPLDQWGGAGGGVTIQIDMSNSYVDNGVVERLTQRIMRDLPEQLRRRRLA